MAKKLVLGITKANIGQHLQRYLETKSMADEATGRVRKQRDSVIAYIAKHGIEDEQGHRWVEVGDFRAKRERRISSGFDDDTAMAYLTDNQELFDDCVTMVPMIDEDKLMAAIFDGRIPEDVAEEWYTEKESFALKVEDLHAH